MRSCVAALVVLAAACGPKKGPDGGGGGGGDGAGNTAGTGAGTASGGGSGDDGGDDAPAPLTRGECERMIDHVLQIGMAEQRKAKPAEYVPTDAQVAEIRVKLAAEQLQPCLAWPRPVWECTIAATTMAALFACGEGTPP
jgi:hypothetical protein